MSLASQVGLAITAIGTQIKALRLTAIQTGDLIYSATSTRTGALQCNGASYLRTDYPALFTAIGTTYGAADGTHFNVPNFSGRVVVGTGIAATGGSTSRTRGETGGEEAHQLTTAELAAHVHGLSQIKFAAGGSGQLLAGTTGSTGSPASQTTDSAGSGTAHNNMQPFGVCMIFIKT